MIIHYCGSDIMPTTRPVLTGHSEVTQEGDERMLTIRRVLRQ